MNLRDVQRGADIARAEADEQIAHLERRLVDLEHENDELRATLFRVRALVDARIGSPDDRLTRIGLPRAA